MKASDPSGVLSRLDASPGDMGDNQTAQQKEGLTGHAVVPKKLICDYKNTCILLVDTIHDWSPRTSSQKSRGTTHTPATTTQCPPRLLISNVGPSQRPAFQRPVA